MEQRFWPAIGALAILALLSLLTLSGPIRWATLLFLAGLALKTWIALLRHRQEKSEQSAQNTSGSHQAPAGGEQ